MKFLDENGLLYVIQKVKTWLNGKVDKVDGKGLSTNDYTTDEKNKLANIEAGANKTTINDTLTSTSTTEALSANQGKVLSERIAAINTNMEDLGAGDMLKSTYDVNGDGIVDNAEKLGGQLPSYYAKQSELETVDMAVTNLNSSVSNLNDEVVLYSTSIGSLEDLSTEEQETIVGAINEVYDNISNQGIDIQNLGIDLSREDNLIRENIGTLSNLTTTAKTDLVSAINEVNSSIPTNNNQLTNGAGYQTADQVNAAIEAVVGSAPEALDTLKELADALGNDKDFASTITTELGKKVNTTDLVAISNSEIDTICA